MNVIDSSLFKRDFLLVRLRLINDKKTRDKSEEVRNELELNLSICATFG